jgi:hypothetical protein
MLLEVSTPAKPPQFNWTRLAGPIAHAIGPDGLRAEIAAVNTLREEIIELRGAADVLYAEIMPRATREINLDRAPMLQAIVAALEKECEFWGRYFLSVLAIEEVQTRAHHAAEGSLLNLEREIKRQHGVPDDVTPTPISLWQGDARWWTARRTLDLTPLPYTGYSYDRVEQEQSFVRVEQELGRYQQALDDEPKRLVAALAEAAKRQGEPVAPAKPAAEEKISKRRKQVAALLETPNSKRRKAVSEI